MDRKCEIIKDQIADFVIGILPDSQKAVISRHISECSNCRDYAGELEIEDRQLTELFAGFDADMARQCDEVVNAIDRLGGFSAGNIFRDCKMALENSITRFAGTAAVIAFVTLYFIITLTWISQIKECIQISS